MVNKSESITKIAPALLQAQREFGNAIKDSKNPFFKSSYADLNSVRDAVTPALHKAGIVLLQLNVSENGKNIVRTTLLHESGEFICSDIEIITAKSNDPQSYGSAISYARRYGLSSMLSVGAEDDDSERAMDRTTSTKAYPVAAGGSGATSVTPATNGTGAFGKTNSFRKNAPTT